MADKPTQEPDEPARLQQPAEPARFQQPAEPARFDDILARLRGLVERLESGNLPLEDGLRYFEEGMELCRQGALVLDKAEKRVEVLLSAAGGGTTTEPLDGTTEDDENA